MAFPQRFFEVKINGTWEDLTNDVISSQECQYGILGNKWDDRVASVGTLKFSLRNDSLCSGGYENYYLPGTPHAKPGWRKRLPVRLRFLYAGTSITKFYGHITDIDIKAEKKSVDVLVADFIDYAANNKVSDLNVEYDKDISGVVQSVVTHIPNQPLKTDYNLGQDIFPSVFDTINEKTKALSEFQKAALSELGYVYVRRDREFGETLVVEGRHTRNQFRQISRVPITDGFWLWEDGSYILWEDGSKMLLDSAEDALFTEKATSLDVAYGDNLSNQVIIKAYPRTVDTTYSVLFSLSNAEYLAPGETKTFSATYTDITGRTDKVCSSDVISPVASTDYLFNLSSDGTGPDMTMYLTVTPTYSSNGATFELTNTSLTLGAYVTKLQIRGKAIFLYDTVNSIAEDAASIAENDYITLNLDMKYQDSFNQVETFGKVILDKEKDARTVVNKVNFNIKDEQLTYAFLYLDIGDLIHLVDSKNDVDGYYYIQGVNFNLRQGGFITFSWNLIEATQLTEDYWLLGITGYSELGTTTKLGY